MKYVLAIILALAATSVASAGNNCNAIYQPQAIVQQVVAAYYNPYAEYRVGQSIIDEATRIKLAEDIADRVVAKLRAAGVAKPTTPEVPPEGTLSNTAPPFLTARCAKCHSGPSPKGGLTLDGSQAVDDATFRRSVEILSGRNIPKAMVPHVAAMQPADKGGVTQELLDLAPKPAAKNELPPRPTPPVADTPDGTLE